MAPSAVMSAMDPACGGFDLASFSRRHGGVTKSALRRGGRLFAQGDPADEMFYLDQGQVQLAVLTVQSRKAIVAILTAGDFCGESCLADDDPRQIATATCIADSIVARIPRPIVIRAVQQDPGFAELCVTYFLGRTARLTERLISQFFDSSERRLARILLQLSNHGGQDSTVIRNLDQEALAQLIGTSRSRTNYFMNKFRELGYIRYDGYNSIIVNDSLSHVVSRENSAEASELLNDRPDWRGTV